MRKPVACGVLASFVAMAAGPARANAIAASASLGLPSPAVAAWSIVPGGGQFALGDPLRGGVYLVAWPALAVGADFGLQALLLQRTPTSEERTYLAVVGAVAGWALTSLVSGLDAYLTVGGRVADARDAVGGGEPVDHFGLALDQDADQPLTAGVHHARVVALIPTGAGNARATGPDVVPGRVRWSYAGAIAPAPGIGAFVARPGNGSVEATLDVAGGTVRLAADVRVAEALPLEPVHHHRASGSLPVALPASSPSAQPTPAPATTSVPLATPSAAAPQPEPTPTASAPSDEDRISRAYGLARHGRYADAWDEVSGVTLPDWQPKARALRAQWGPRAADELLAAARAALKRKDPAAARTALSRLGSLPLDRFQRAQARDLARKAR